MMPALVVEIVTPKRIALKGLWFGPRRAKKVVVFVHGLGGSAFSMLSTVGEIIDSNTAVLTFSNRGHDAVSGLSQAGPFKRKWKIRRYAGAAHEKFTDCVDDLQGAINFARKSGAREIFLAGHSTGCQKSIYWAYKRKGKGVKGIILLAPVSDYAGAMERHGKRKLERAARAARKMVKEGRGHELLPRTVWPEELDDAQRFLSLYTPDSVEEIFSYAQPKKQPRILRSVRLPILVVWAGGDEYSKRPLREIENWFMRNLKKGHIVTVPRVPHRFTGGEKHVSKEMRAFMKEAAQSAVYRISR